MPESITPALTTSGEIAALVTHLAGCKGASVEPMLLTLTQEAFDAAKKRGDTNELGKLDTYLSALLDTHLDTAADTLRIAIAAAASHLTHMRSLTEDDILERGQRVGATAHTARAAKDAAAALDAATTALETGDVDAVTAAVTALEPTGRETEPCTAPVKSPIASAAHTAASAARDHTTIGVSTQRADDVVDELLTICLADHVPEASILGAVFDTYDKMRGRARPLVATSDLRGYLNDMRKDTTS